MPIEAFPINCDGGLVLDKSVFIAQPGEAITLQNYEPSVTGGYSKIQGFDKFNTNQVTGSGGLLGLAIWNDTVVAARGSNVMYGSSGVSSWTSITTARSSAERYTFSVYNWSGTEKIAMADGVNDAATYDGSTYLALTGGAGSGAGTKPAAPEIVVEHKNHLFFSGMTSNRHLVQFSSPYSENDFSPASGGGQISIGDEIVGLAQFRETLVIFCKDSIYRLAGSSAADFVLQPVTRNIGCVSRFSIQEIAGDLIYLAPDGLRTIAGTEKIGDTELGTISKQVQSRLNGLTAEQVSKVSSHIIRRKSQYRVYYPTALGTDAESTGLIAVIKGKADTGQMGWEYADLKGLKPSCAAHGDISNVEYVLHGDYDGGYVYQQEQGHTFDGTNLEAIYRTIDYNMGDVGVRKNMQRIVINYIGTGSVSSVDMNLEYDYGDILLPSPALYDLLDPTGSAFYDSALAGTAEYDAKVYTPLYRQSVEGSGFAVALKFTDTSTNPTYTLKGFSLEFTPGARM
jgi:hypothetical protein|tara:strand:+ start:2372 stop:3907 length:1536 start_codon:yes stop_codon:yes gene_type:complete